MASKKIKRPKKKRVRRRPSGHTEHQCIMDEITGHRGL